MDENSTHEWDSASGAKYRFLVTAPGEPVSAGAGVYIHAARALEGWWMPIYIGEGADLAGELPADAAIRACTQREGATHLHILFEPDPATRARIASDLLARWITICNPPQDPQGNHQAANNNAKGTDIC